MSKPVLRISLTKTSLASLQALAKHNSGEAGPAEIPLPYNTDGRMACAPCRELNPTRVFGRAGLLPFAEWEGTTYIFLNLFKGTDRAAKVIELSDFGGRHESGESYLRTACYEAAEETLGLFNFLGQESTIRSTSFSSYTLDRSLITTAVPIVLKTAPLELAKNYVQRKRKLNGPLEAIESLPAVHLAPHELLSELKSDFVTLHGNNVAPSCRGDSQLRRKPFNTNESANLVYLELETFAKLLEARRCPMPEALFALTEERYSNFPPVYPYLLPHMKQLLPFISNYVFDQQANPAS